MRSLKKGPSAPPISNEDAALVQMSDPVKFLQALQQISRRPDRYQVAWDAESLSWIARMWHEASLVAVGDADLVAACLKERDRYRFLARELFVGERERKEPGVAIMNEPGDWPHPAVMQRAIAAFEHADIRVVQ